MSYLLDTNVVSELGRKSPDRNVVTWVTTIDPDEQYLSVLTIGEIAKGVMQLESRDARRSAALSKRLDGLRINYADRIIVVDAEIAEAWGRLAAARSTPIVDTLIAATALVHRLTLVTRNVRDFADAGIPILNPWDI